ncbi:heterokaryon incompatibility protein-domain-containing protein [Ganoderma leucocontextum]|nr:heterokaryon incompatibility protein-domain-containing protein [Ganoderma leucocontextum]
MRLLDTRTGNFVWVNHPEKTRYAILSHVWSREPGVEQTYHDIVRIQGDVRRARITDPTIPADEVLRRASSKIRNACRYALSDGLPFIWIDAPCIDKTSSAELSEAINSMYEWYRLSTVCYAFLHDVDADEDPYEADEFGKASSFRLSVWHTRGWTLQELIAPATVVFLSRDWRMIGGKHRLADVVQDVTGIDASILTHSRPLDTIPVARRMFWASKRQTTRKEDEAYSLMGIFGVHIPTIYGEGPKAFLRLQEEILKQIPDQTIFVWYRHAPASIGVEPRDDTHDSLLASSSAHFALSGDIKTIPKAVLARKLGIPELPPTTYIVTSEGIRVTFPLRPIAPSVDIGVLACEDADGNLLGLVLRQTKLAYVRCVGAPLDNAAFLGQSSRVITDHPSVHVYTIPALSVDQTTEHKVSEVYVVYRRSLSALLPRPSTTFNQPSSSRPFKLVFSRLRKNKETEWTYTFIEPALVEPIAVNAAAQPVVDPSHPGPTRDALSYALRISGPESEWTFEAEFTPSQCTVNEADHWSLLAAKTTFVYRGEEVVSQVAGPELEKGDDDCRGQVHRWQAPSEFHREMHFSYLVHAPSAHESSFRVAALGPLGLPVRITLHLDLEHPGSHAYSSAFSLSADVMTLRLPDRDRQMPRHRSDMGRLDYKLEPIFMSAQDRPVRMSINYGQCNMRDALDQSFPHSMQADDLVPVGRRHLWSLDPAAPMILRLSVMNRAEHIGRINPGGAGGRIGKPPTRGMLAAAIAQEVRKFLERERARGDPLRYGDREVQLEDLVLVNVEQPSWGELVPMLALSIDDEEEA